MKGVSTNSSLFTVLSAMLPLFFAPAAADAQMMHGGGRSSGGASGAAPYFDPTNAAGFTNKLLLPGDGGLMGVLDADGPLAMTIVETGVSLVPGKTAGLIAYKVERNGKTYFNPVLKIKRGAELAVDLTNGLREPTIIHWHGILSDSTNDGLPQYAVAPGGTYRYRFTVNNRAGTYWYHPHPHSLTGRQAYFGLAGFLIVEDRNGDELDRALGLSLGATDIPLLIQDKRFAADGRLAYDPDPMERFMGFYGNNILVNLTPKPYLDAPAGRYRFRLLNGSNARIYRLAFEKSGGALLPYHVIAGDGGLLDKPHAVKELFLAPGERAEVLLDLGGEAPGAEIFLKSLAFDPMENEEGGMGGMMGMMMDHQAAVRPANGEAFYILKVNVKGNATSARAVPAALAASASPDPGGARVRELTLSQRNMRWFINGTAYAMGEFPIEVRRGAKEIWEIRNEELSMPHPMHIHGFQFWVLERRNSPAQVNLAASDASGLTAVDRGLKDTVLVWPGETVRVLVDFSHGFSGTQDFVFHCHILEHEDGGMMLNFRVLDREGAQ